MAAWRKTLGSGLPLLHYSPAIAAAWLLITMSVGGLLPAPAFVLCLSLLSWLRLRADGRLFDRSPDAAVWLLLCAVYLSTFRWHGGDDMPNSLLPFSILRHGTLSLDPVLTPWFTGKIDDFTVVFHGIHLSVFPVAPGLLALPFYLVTAAFHSTVSEPALHGLSKLSGAAITALSAVVLRRALKGRCSEGFSLTLTLMYGLGTWAFSVSSQALWQHGPSALGVALGLWGLNEKGRKHDVVAGFGFSLAVACRPDCIFFAIAATIWILLSNPRRISGFLLGAAIPAAQLAGYWVWYTGRLSPPELSVQTRAFAGFQPGAVAGLMLSPTRGLFTFFPAAAFGIWGAWRARDTLPRLMVLSIAGLVVTLSFRDTWYGGSTFGTRYFAASAMVLCWAAASLEPWLAASRRRALAFKASAVFSVLVHSAGAYLLWPGSTQWDIEKETLWSWSLHPVINTVTTDGALKSLPFFIRVTILCAAVYGITLGSGLPLLHSPREQHSG